jgi:hypothetical protein
MHQLHQDKDAQQYSGLYQQPENTRPKDARVKAETGERNRALYILSTTPSIPS